MLQRVKPYAVLGLLGTAAMSSSAYAATIYETADARLQVGGRIAAYSTFVNGVDNDNDPKNAGSRVNVVHEYNLADGWSTITRAEWGFDPFFTDGTNDHFKRLLYTGVSSEEYGTILVGKQWSLWYDMLAWYTDYFWIGGAAAQGSFNAGFSSDGGEGGLGRADNAISWQNTFDRLTVGLMYQIEGDEFDADVPDYSNISRFKRKYGAQGVVRYAVTDDWNVGIALNHSNIESTLDSDEQSSANANAALFGTNWAPGNWYFALTAGEYRDTVFDSSFSGLEESGSGIVDRARGYEGVAHYTFNDVGPGKFELYSGFNRLEHVDSSAREAFYLFGAAYFLLDDNLILAAEFNLDDSQDASGNDINANSTALMVRYNY